ncbi:MAG: metallophosphoesterase family protein [Rhodobacteraceae bacterium]|nr:metallophosphoesterase family protein [Paracoccaceae bacterium]
MRLALLSDIHANREAFQAVMDDLADRQIDRMVFLGDIVGYGPDPGWCLDRVADHVAQGAICLRGNHDRAVGVPERLMNVHARRVIDWTVNCLNARQKLFLSELPLAVVEEDTLFVHASADDPANWTYVTDCTAAAASLRATDARLTLCGHVHRPALYSQDPMGRVHLHEAKPATALPLLHSRRWLAVIGSVGQPRDGTGLAAYAILDRTANDLTFRRVAYDHGLTARKARDYGLPESLARRLMQGV